MDTHDIRVVLRAAFAAALLLAPSVSCSPPSEFNLAFAFKGPATSSSTVYAVWLEDESGNDIQNIYVCNRVLGIGKPLTGKALPNWLTKKYPQNKNVQGLTGASAQKAFSVSRGISIGAVRKFRVCFEIDRSWNGNDFFPDRPAFTYSSGLIDLDDLQASYPLSLSGWMSNEYGTKPGDDSSLSQQPWTTPAGYAPYVFMTGFNGYLADTGSSASADLVSSVQATIVRN